MFDNLRVCAPRSTLHAVALSCLALAFGPAGCGDDGAGGAGGGGGSGGTAENEGVVACRAACDTQLEDCATFDLEGCNTICDAYEITADTEECASLLADWQTCLAGLTYMCAPAPDDDIAFPTDPAACDAQADAYLDNPDC